MRFQFSVQSINNRMGLLNGWLLAFILLGLSVFQLIMVKRLSAAVWMSLYGTAFYILGLNGKAWYAFSFNIGLCLIMMGLLVSGSQIVHRYSQVLLSITFGGVLYLFATYIDSAVEGLDSIKPTVDKVSVPLLRADEIQEVRRIINTLPPGSSVSFGVSGMAPFFFEDIASAGLKWAWLTKSVLPGTPIREHDYGFDCVSIWEPDAVQIFRAGQPRSAADRGCKLKVLKGMALEGS